jgi:hypothetical protein
LDVSHTSSVELQNQEQTLPTNSEEIIPEENLQPLEQGPVDSVAVLTTTAKPASITKQAIAPKSTNAALKQENTEARAQTQVLQPEIKKEEVQKMVEENDDTAEKKAVKKNINDLIKVVEDYKVGAFGGLNDIQLQVTNNSPYPVDVIVVEVKYLLANKKEFKTENVYFKNVAPGITMSKEAPKSPRGIKVASKVALITSKALGMYQASL